MKGKLFGGMKVKGPSVKQQQTKKQQAASVSQTSLDFKPQQRVIEHKAQTKSQSHDEPPEPQMKHSKTSLQSVLKQQPKLHKKQSIKQTSQKHSSSSNIQKEQVLEPSDKGSQKLQGQLTSKKQQPSTRKDFTKSRSEKNYDGEDSEDNNDVREDRSVVVGRQEEKEQIEFKKNYKSKPTVTGPKSNPLLNQIKKITTKAIQKDKQPQSQNKGSKQSISSNKPQKPHQMPKRQKSTIMQQLYSSHSRILQQLIKKKQAKQQIITLTTHMLELKEQLSVLTNKQNHYITTEEYELADKLEGKITQLTAQVNEDEVQIGFAQEELFKMELQGVTLLRAHLEEEKRTIRRLKLVELDIEDEIAHFKRQQEEKIETSKSLNQNQKKKYQRIVCDIKNQSQQLQKYEKTFYQDLNSRKSPLEAQLTEQQQKCAELQSQIKQLQEKLKKKKALLKFTLSSIESTRQKIAEVDQTFQQEKEKLEERKRHITVLQGEKDQQHRKMQDMQNQLKQFQSLKTQHLARMSNEKHSYANLSIAIQTFFSSIDVQQYLNTKKHAIEQFMKHSRALKAFEDKHKEKREKIKELEFQKSNTLSEITKNEERIKELKQRIPKLQTEQKQLSLAKNFKGAAMKKSQIKECADSIDQIKKQIEQAYATEAQIDAKVEQINADQEKYVQEENELRKSLALSQFRLAVQKKNEIGKELQWLRELEKDNRVRETYEGRLEQELTEIEEEISYISQEYELEEERPTPKHSRPLTTSKPLQNQPSTSLNEPSSYEYPVQQTQQRPATSSNKALSEEEPQPQTQSHDDAPEQYQNEHSHHTQSRQQSVYEPLQLEVNGEEYEDEHHSGEGHSDKGHQDEDRHGEEEEQDAGYVPLQLD